MKLERNEICFCGSGKKYKKCCYNPTSINDTSSFNPSQTNPQIDSYMDLAEHYYKSGDILNAAHLGKEILKIKPKHHQALFLCGVIMNESGRYSVAANLISSAISQKPKEHMYYRYLTLVYNKLNRYDLALASIEKAMKLSPNNGDLYNLLGITLIIGANYLEAKEAFLKAIEYKNDMQYYLNLAVCLSYAGFTNELKDLYQKLVAKNPLTIMRIPFLALAVPVIADSYDKILAMRQWVNSELDVLHNAKLQNDCTGSLDTLRNILKNPLFNLAYHGFNDKVLVSKFNNLYKKHLPFFNYVAPHINTPTKLNKKKKPKVGFLSNYFWNHSVGRCFNKLISKLGEINEVEITVFTEKCQDDQSLQKLANSRLNYIELPFHYDYAKKIVAEAELDILIYTDIGMNEETYALAMARLARIQCCLSGHPVTTGLSTIDYYISSKNFEPKNAQDHYSETLLLLNNAPVLIEKPQPPTNIPNRAALNMPENGILYVCPMTLYKIHPEFDEIMAGILRADPKGYIVLFDDYKVKSYKHTLKRRFSNVISDVEERIIFLPWLRGEYFYQFIVMADVILDPIHFGGGTTTYFVMAQGVPMVTLPFESLRSSITASCYKLMNIPEMIAKDKDHYIEIAVKIANDPILREKIKDQILKANNILFNNEEEVVGELNQLLHNLVSNKITQYLTT